VGDGSDCLGFDDKYSTDHDWDRILLVAQQSRTRAIRARLRDEYSKLPLSFQGSNAPPANGEIGRVGVFEIGTFYRAFLGGTEYLPR